MITHQWIDIFQGKDNVKHIYQQYSVYVNSDLKLTILTRNVFFHRTNDAAVQQNRRHIFKKYYSVIIITVYETNARTLRTKLLKVSHHYTNFIMPSVTVNNQTEIFYTFTN
jgi:hypothetical protein